MKVLRNKVKVSVLAFFAITSIALTACSNIEGNTAVTSMSSAVAPSEILASVTWKTTVVKNQKGEDVTASNGGFVGLADYKKDGSFEIKGFDGAIRSSGIWALTADGEKRILVTDKWTRIVDVIVLNKNLFTYRIKNADGVIVDVEHVPN